MGPKLRSFWVGTKEHVQNVETNSGFSTTAEFLQRKQHNWKIAAKQNNHEKRVSWKVSWRKKDCGISQATKLHKTEVPCPRKQATPQKVCGNARR